MFANHPTSQASGSRVPGQLSWIRKTAAQPGTSWGRLWLSPYVMSDQGTHTATAEGLLGDLFHPCNHSCPHSLWEGTGRKSTTFGRVHDLKGERSLLWRNPLVLVNLDLKLRSPKKPWLAEYAIGSIVDLFHSLILNKNQSWKILPFQSNWE